MLFAGVKPERRPILIKDFLTLDGRPSTGYIHLAVLAKRGLIDCVITTNFDSFLEKAANIVSDDYSIFSVQIPHLLRNNVLLEELNSSTVPIIKIHGDCNHGIYDITNDELNSSAYPENVTNLLHQIFKTHEVIFIGYGGHEKKLAKALMPIVNELNHMYWFNPQPASTATKLYSVIEDYLLYEGLPTDESELYFDNVMKEIASAVFSKDVKGNRGVNKRKSKKVPEKPYIDTIKTQVATWNRKRLTHIISDDNSVAINDVFISRDTIDRELKDFFGREASMFILVGKSGFGKTTLLKKMVADFDNSEDAFMFVPVKTLPKELLKTVGLKKGGFLKKVIASNLEISLPDLEPVNKELEDKKRNFIIVLDGLNEFSTTYSDCESFYKMVYDSAEELDDLGITRIKFVISCRNETWHQLQQCYTQFSKKSVFYNSGNPIILNQFDADEFKRAYEKYKSAYSIKTTYEKLLPLAKERLMDPFMLNLACVAKKGEEISFETPSIDLYNRFFKIKFEIIYQTEIDIPLKYLSDFAQKCFDRKTSKLELMDIPPRADDDLLRYLFDLNILEKAEGADKSTYYSWSHDRFFSFFLSKALRNIRLNDENDLLPLLEQSSSFLPLYGALKFILLSCQDIRLFAGLLNSGNEDIQSLLKDVLFETSQSNSEKFEQIFKLYSNQQSTIEGMRLLLQAASLNTILKEIVFQLMVTSEEPYIQAESNYFFISLCIKEINRKAYKLDKNNVIKTLSLYRKKTGWVNISTLLSLISRLSWDNYKGDVKEYYKIIGELLLENFLSLSFENMNELSKRIEHYTNKYFFNAQNIEEFFNRLKEDKTYFQNLVDEIKNNSDNVSEGIKLVKEFMNRREYKIERMIMKIFIILLGRRNFASMKQLFWELLHNAASAEQGDFCTGSIAYLTVSNEIYDGDLLYDINEFFLKHRTDLFDYESDYETLFNPIGTYGLLFPIKNKGIAIDLYNQYITLFVAQKNNNFLLKILHALRQSVSLFTKEGLATLKPLLDYRENKEVRTRMIEVLGESFARNPEITSIFLAQNDLSFTKKEQYTIKFGTDPKIHAHAITILEWGRLYHFFFSNKKYRLHVHEILTILNKSSSLVQAISRIVDFIKNL